jgi:hypothetical protein
MSSSIVLESRLWSKARSKSDLITPLTLEISVIDLQMSDLWIYEKVKAVSYAGICSKEAMAYPGAG